MNRTRGLFIGAALAAMVATSSLSQTPVRSYVLDEFDWLIGTWQGQTDGGASFFETWCPVNDSTWAGHGFRVVDGDTVFGEALRLECRGGRIVYIADVAHNAAEVGFDLVSATDTSAVFENPSHDFPQRLAYVLTRATGASATDTLRVSAESLDRERKLPFTFVRLP